RRRGASGIRSRRAAWPQTRVGTSHANARDLRGARPPASRRQLGFPRMSRVIEPALVEVIAGTFRVGTPDQIGKARKQREVEIARTLRLLTQRDAERRIAGHDREALQGTVLVPDRRDDVVA